MLISIHPLPDDLQLGLWQIEPQSGLNARQNERQAVRLLLEQMLGTSDFELTHEASGKPVLQGWHISVSHTRGYAAVLLSRSHEVGVDIEYASDRVSRIASRFLRPDEHPQTVAETLAFWSAKETIFKLFSAQKLTYQEMRISPTDDPATLRAENLRQGISIPVSVTTNAHFTLTHAFL